MDEATLFGALAGLNRDEITILAGHLTDWVTRGEKQYLTKTRLDEIYTGDPAPLNYESAIGLLKWQLEIVE
jgi:hypothetical protein